MTPLRQKLIDEIQLRGFSIHTQDSYLRCVTGLALMPVGYSHSSKRNRATRQFLPCTILNTRYLQLGCASILIKLHSIRSLNTLLRVSRLTFIRTILTASSPLYSHSSRHSAWLN